MRNNGMEWNAMETNKNEMEKKRKTCEMNILIYFSLFDKHSIFKGTKESLEGNPEKDLEGMISCGDTGEAGGRAKIMCDGR